MFKILNSKQFNLLFLICVFYFLFLVFNFCQAAILYFEPLIGDYHQGDVFLVDVRLDTQGEIINAVEINLNFNKDILEFKDTSWGDSILTLWTQEPKVSDNTISLSGGIPGGYWGKDGLLGKIVFRVVDVKHLQGETQIATQNNAEIKFLEGSRVLLNDGLGTLAKLETRGAVFEILTGEGGKNLWQEEIDKDKILPEPFKIELYQESSIFEGKYFITFSTTDKETGIDHYEVKEGKEDWKIAASPYVLKNQDLMANIWVKALDKAGNYWIESIEISQKSDWNKLIYLILILLALILISVILKVRRIRNKHLLT